MVRFTLLGFGLLWCSWAASAQTQNLTTIIGASAPPDGLADTQSIRVSNFLPLGSSEYLIGSGYEAWKMNASGTLTRVLGSGVLGSGDTNDNPLTADLSIGPTALSPSGEWYWVEGSSIRKLNKVTGKIQTTAGSTTSGFSGDNGPALQATFSFPSDIIFGPDGNLYVCDDDNFRVRKVDMVSQVVTTVVGSGSSAYNGDNIPATSAGIWPQSIAFDPSGNMLVTDQARIRKISAGTITTICGNGSTVFSGDNGLASSATTTASIGSYIRCDLSGNIFFGENTRIRKISGSTGVITTYAGTGTPGYAGDGGPATSAMLQFGGKHLSLDQAGNLFIAEASNAVVRKVDASTGIITTIAGNGKSGYYSGDGTFTSNSLLSDPWGIKLKGNKLYVASWILSRVFVLDLSTNLMTTLAGTGNVGFSGDDGQATMANLGNPIDVEVDGAGNIYISDNTNRRIRKVAAGTGIITTIAGTGLSTFNGENIQGTTANINPTGIALRGSDLYFYEIGNRIRKLSLTTGLVNTIAGNGTPGFTGNGGPATSASISGGRLLTVSGDSVLYFAETFNHAVRKVNLLSGKIFAVAGTGVAGNSGYNGDNIPATQATLNLPASVAVLPNGNIVIADTFNDRIRMIDGNGIITTIAGTGFRGDEGDGIATDKKLAMPRSILADENGVIYFSETSGNKIRRLVFEDVATALDEIQSSEIQFYPVPTRSKITIVSAKSDIESVAIVNMLGSSILTDWPGTREVSYTLDGQAPGVYLARVVCNGQTMTKRLILLGQ